MIDEMHDFILHEFGEMVWWDEDTLCLLEVDILKNIKIPKTTIENIILKLNEIFDFDFLQIEITLNHCTEYLLPDDDESRKISEQLWLDDTLFILPNGNLF